MRRHVIYVQGYDPRGLAQYYRMFRTELKKFDALHGVQSNIGRPVGATEQPVASWTIETRARDWQTSTQYDYLHWEDLIAPDFKRPMWWTVGYSLYVLLFSIVTGGIFRMWRAHWRFVIFLLYPFALLSGIVWGAAVIGSAAGAAVAQTGLPVLASSLIGLATGIGALFALIKLLAARTYLLYLMADGCSTYQFATGQRSDWDARIDEFARHVASVCKTSHADEILIIGHSSGSFMAVEVLARALKLDPDLGRRNPSVALLTLGSNLPIVGYVPAAKFFRDNLQRIAFEDSIRWIDCQSRKDVMNFYPYDPIAGHGLDTGAPRRNPLIVSVRFRELIAPENYKWFRWKFFRVHFQFLMSNERKAAYDFFLIVTGPLSLPARFDLPDEDHGTESAAARIPA